MTCGIFYGRSSFSPSFCSGRAAAGPGAAARREAHRAGHRQCRLQAGKLATLANDAGLVAQTLQAAGFDVVGARDLDQESLRRAFKDFLEKASSFRAQHGRIHLSERLWPAARRRELLRAGRGPRLPAILRADPGGSPLRLYAAAQFPQSQGHDPGARRKPPASLCQGRNAACRRPRDGRPAAERARRLRHRAGHDRARSQGGAHTGPMPRP